MPTTEGTAKIPTQRVSRMREEANPTMAASDRAVSQIGIFAQHGIQRLLILANKRTGAVVLVPIVAKRKKFRDGHYKNAKFSVKISNVLGMSSSYTLDAKASRWTARISYAHVPKNVPHLRIIGTQPTRNTPARRYLLPDRPKLPTWKTSMPYSLSK